MCKYCEEAEAIFDIDVISKGSWGWRDDETKINYNQAISDTDKYQVFIDRGFIRYVDSEDCNCIDHGEKVKINFCPFCGIKIR